MLEEGARASNPPCWLGRQCPCDSRINGDVRRGHCLASWWQIVAFLPKARRMLVSPRHTQKASFVLIVFSTWNYVLLHHSSCRHLLHPGISGSSEGVWSPGYTGRPSELQLCLWGPAASPGWCWGLVAPAVGAGVDTGTGMSSLSISACGCSRSQRPRAASAQAAGRRGRQNKK